MALFKGKLKRTYVSDIDIFLESFDKQPEATSDSRKAEEEKYARLNKLRDDANVEEETSPIWERF